MDEFIDGCAKLQGEATALETKVLHLEAVIFFSPNDTLFDALFDVCELISPSKKIHHEQLSSDGS